MKEIDKEKMRKALSDCEKKTLSSKKLNKDDKETAVIELRLFKAEMGL